MPTAVPAKDRREASCDHRDDRSERLGEDAAGPAEDAAGERRTCADREIDLAGNDHRGHAEGDDPHHRDGTQHVEEVVDAGKARRKDHEEDDEREQDQLEHDHPQKADGNGGPTGNRLNVGCHS